MNNRFKVALLALSLVATTPQMHAGWFDLNSWVKPITTAANTINQNVKNYIFPPKVETRAVVPAVNNTGILANISKWWYGKKYTKEEVAALTKEILKEKAETVAEEKRLFMIAAQQAQDAERAYNQYHTEKQLQIQQTERQQWKTEVEQREKELRFAGEKIQQRDQNISSLNEQSANERNLRLKQTKELQEKIDLLKIDDEVNKYAHLDLLLTTETLEKDRNILAQQLAQQLEEAQSTKNNLEYDLFLTQCEKEVLEGKLQNQKALLSNPAVIQVLRPRSKPATTNGITEVAQSFTNISSLADSWTEIKLTEAQSALFDEATQDGFDKITQHIQMDPGYTSEQTSLGKKYTVNLLTGVNLHEIPTGTQEEYMKSIVAIQWYLYSKALENGQGFVEGTFKIQDPGFKIYNFFMDYIKKYNKDITGTPKDPLAHISYNQFGYSRDTSHYTDKKRIYSAYGIDVRLGKDSPELALLPANKQHITFGKLDEENGWIYMKPENHGIYWYDGLPYHVNEFVVAQARKNSWITYTLSWLGINLGSDDAETNRKERVPANFVKAVVQAVGKKHPLVNAARNKGIQIIHGKEFTEEEALKKIAEEYKQQYDNTEHRSGQEVILMHDTLLRDASSKGKEKKQ